MNLLLFQGSELASGRLLLPPDDPRHQHLLQVLKARKGDSLRAARINGPRGRLLLESEPSARHMLKARFEEQEAAGPALQGQVFLALPRPQTLRKILFLMPQLGLKRLVLLRSKRVEKSFYHSPLLSTGEWRRHLLAGMEQAMQSLMPEVHLYEYFRPFMEDRLPGLLTDGPRILLHPGRPALNQSPQLAPGDWQLAIGPEGGWQDHEREAWEDAGFIWTGLGERILRVESAFHHAIAQLQVLQQRNQS
jgi:16S rRNA (uracil1498-N3)-methyltransferase